MKITRYLFISLVLAPFIDKISAQDSLTICDKFVCKSSIIPIPVVYYTPETRLSGGAAVLYAFRFREQPLNQRPSQLQFGAVYTQNKQVLFYLPFQVFTNRERYQVNGELGYYKYVYQWYGIGNRTPESDKELYDSDYPRLRINGLYQFQKDWYAGFRYWWDDYKISARDGSEILMNGRLTGSTGGIISGIGALLNYDSRDQIFYPTKGAFVETEFFFNQKSFGSDFNFSRFSMDARTYLSSKKENILALEAWLVSLQGNPPFQQLALLGGPKKMRGYFEGRYRDNQLWGLQGEYRFALFWRITATVFGGMGNVSPTFGSLFSQQVHFTYGAGLRILLAKQDHINLRIDVGANEHGEVFPYLTVGEAF